MNWLLNDPQYIGLRLAAFLVILTLFAIPSLPLISAFSQSLAKSHKKSFYDKFGKQLTRMCLIFGGIALATLGLGVARYLTLDTTMLQGPYQLPIIVTAGVTVLAAVFVTVYFKAWKAMRKQKSAHIALGFFSSFLLFAAICCIAILASSLMNAHPLPSLGNATDIFWALFLTAYSPTFITFLTIGFAMGFCLCGAFSQMYLLARRDKDDFGRDYYKFAMPYAAKWAIFGAVLQIVATVTRLNIWILFQIIKTGTPEALIQNPLILTWASALGLPILACILWALTAASATPMRRKVSVYCAGTLILVADVCLITLAYLELLALFM